MYTDIINYIRKENIYSEKFKTRNGLWQGVVSPSLFITIIGDIIKALKNMIKKVNHGYQNLKTIIRICLDFEREKDLQLNLEMERCTH